MYLKFLILIIFFIAKDSISFADAWVQKRGEGLIINSLYFSSFKETNHITGGVNDKLVGSVSYGLYFEYGFLEKLTIGGKLFLNDYSYINDRMLKDFKGQNFGIQFAEIFGRYLLFQKYNFVASFYTGFAFPGIYNSSSYPMEYAIKTYDIDFRLELGYSFDNLTNLQLYQAEKLFITYSAGYRKKIQSEYDEIRLELTIGIPIFHDLIILTRFQKINYVFLYDGNFQPNNLNFLNINSTDFSYAKISLSSVCKITKYSVLEIGIQKTLHYPFLKTNTKIIDFIGIFISYWLYF